MTSADFSRQILFQPSFLVRETSPGKSYNLPPMHLLYLLYGIWAVSDFVMFGRLIRSISALYTVSVRQFGILPPASFRFHLTMDTLALS